MQKDRDAARVHETFRLSLKTAFISGLTAFAVMYVFCPYIVAMFLEPGCPAYGIATKGIPYFASGFICFALNIAWIGYYQSIELARKAMLFMLLRGIILMSICFLALPHLLGEKGLWLAVPCAELIIFIALTMITNTGTRYAEWWNKAVILWHSASPALSHRPSERWTPDRVSCNADCFR